MTLVYIIRHAEAEGNVFRRMDGHYNSRITPNGQRQIEALARRFAEVPIDAVYASDLFRTCETAKAICVPKGLPLHKDARFREVWFGPWEDVPFGWLDQFEPEQMGYFSHDPAKWQVEGSESFAVYSERFRRALEDVARRHEGQRVAVFTHGCVSGESLRAMFGPVMGMAQRCDNTGVTLLRWEDGVFTPEYFYDNSHLTEEISTLAHQLWWRGGHDFNLWYRDPLPEDAALYDPAYPPGSGVTRIAMRMDEPVGYLSYVPQQAEIVCLYLLPRFRYRSRGYQLLGEVVCACRALGHRSLRARIPAENACAAAFFRHVGAFLLPQPDGALLAELEIALPVY